MRVPVALHSISSLDQDTLDNAAVSTVNGLSRCISHTAPLRNEVTISPDFWSILLALHRHEEAAPLVSDLLQTIVESSPPIVTADNYESVVGLADNFISTAGVGSIEERQSDSRSRRPKGAKPPKVTYVAFPS